MSANQSFLINGTSSSSLSFSASMTTSMSGQPERRTGQDSPAVKPIPTTSRLCMLLSENNPQTVRPKSLSYLDPYRNVLRSSTSHHMQVRPQPVHIYPKSTVSMVIPPSVTPLIPSSSLQQFTHHQNLYHRNMNSDLGQARFEPETVRRKVLLPNYANNRQQFTPDSFEELQDYLTINLKGLKSLRESKYQMSASANYSTTFNIGVTSTANISMDISNNKENILSPVGVLKKGTSIRPRKHQKIKPKYLPGSSRSHSELYSNILPKIDNADLLLPSKRICPKSGTGPADDVSGLTVDKPVIPQCCANCRANIHQTDIDYAISLGMSPDALCPERVASRKIGIQHKLRTPVPFFTIEEEYDIHCRAEAYALSIEPDPNYYIADNEMPKAALDFKDESFLWPYTGKGRKRKRKVSSESSKESSLVHNESYPYYSYCINRADGTQLLKPTRKLVELVAEAINNSPDGMLQVQQVYIVIQKKYPYFQHFDKSSQTSWKSSIRHALYQKWFHKIDNFSTDFISVRGCYWAINRDQTPKDWCLPIPNYITELQTDIEIKQEVDADDWADETETWSRFQALSDDEESSNSSQTSTNSQPPSDTNETSKDSVEAAVPDPPPDSQDPSLLPSQGLPLLCRFGMDIKPDPDPILNNLNMVENCSQGSDGIHLVSPFFENLEAYQSSESGPNAQEGSSPDLDTSGLIPSFTVENQAEDVDLYIPVSPDLPFYIGLPQTDDDDHHELDELKLY